jgi:hypothetical protein
MLVHVKPQTPQHEILEQLENSAYTFYLTGSRFFGTSNEFSDWDFFTDSEEAIPELRSLGFNKLNALVYGEGEDNLQELKSVYRHPVGIDIQVVEDVNKKNAIQSALNGTIFVQCINDANKIGRVDFWRAAYNLFNAGFKMGRDNDLGTW